VPVFVQKSNFKYVAHYTKIHATHLSQRNTLSIQVTAGIVT